jgi:hypothetical protein
MRLIDTTTLELREFSGEIPPYAILSHTWGAQEVSLQEFVAGSQANDSRITARDGYQKIVRTCRLAENRKLRYVWVDTCCIDKTSSAELSEAINSMFKWYQNSDVCFVYLVDLQGPNNWTKELRSCRWFTRGWCLQELIAPSVLEFYDTRWTYVGQKNEKFTGLLSKITGITKRVLNDPSAVFQLPVAERMAWAAKRRTTREEDVAYSLMGLFNITMPMVYGEGSKAFLRLQEEIIKKHSDLTIFAWRKPRPPGVGPSLQNTVPPNPDALFIDMLAPDPAWFEGCNNQDFNPMDVSGASFQLTNTGIFFPALETRTGFVDRAGARWPFTFIDISLGKRPEERSSAYIALLQVTIGYFIRVDLEAEVHMPENGEFDDAPSLWRTFESMTVLNWDRWNMYRRYASAYLKLAVHPSKEEPGVRPLRLKVARWFPEGCWDPATDLFHLSAKTYDGRFKIYNREFDCNLGFAILQGDLAPDFCVVLFEFRRGGKLRERRTDVKLIPSSTWREACVDVIHSHDAQSQAARAAVLNLANSAVASTNAMAIKELSKHGTGSWYEWTLVVGSRYQVRLKVEFPHGDYHGPTLSIGLHPASADSVNNELGFMNGQLPGVEGQAKPVQSVLTWPVTIKQAKLG